jgi:hypothetical protein
MPAHRHLRNGAVMGRAMVVKIVHRAVTTVAPVVRLPHGAVMGRAMVVKIVHRAQATAVRAAPLNGAVMGRAMVVKVAVPVPEIAAPACGVAMGPATMGKPVQPVPVTVELVSQQAAPSRSVSAMRT